MAENSAEGGLARETQPHGLSRASSRVSIASLVEQGSSSSCLAEDDRGTLAAAEALGSLKAGGGAGPSSQSYEDMAACETHPNTHFIRRVQAIPIVSSAKEMYTKTKQSNIIVRVGGGVIESGVKRVVEPISKRIPAGVDDFACRQLDNLGYTYPENQQQQQQQNMPINNLRKRTKDQAENEDVDDEAGARDSASYDNGKTKGAAQMSLAATTDEAQAADGRRWGVGSLIASAKERAVAYREDSMRRLKYCLEWVTYATALLNQHIYDLRKFLESLQEAARIVLAGGTNTATLEVAASNQQTESGEEGRQMSANALYATQNVREAALRLAQRKREIVVTVKKAVGIISQYAGSVLPGEARRQVRGLILSLPGRWMTVDTAVSVASSVTSDDSVPRNGAEESSSSSASGNIEANARRTLAFATESFYMLDNVRNVFQNLYVNAERWVGAPSTTNGSAAPEGEEGVPLVAVSAAAPEDPFNTYRDGAKSSSRGGTGKVPVRKPPKKLPAGLVMTAAVEEPSVNSQRLSTQSLVEIGEQMRRMDMSQKRSSMQQQGTSSMMDVDDATTVPHQYLLSSPQFSAVRTTYDEAVANKRNRTREPSPSRGANM